MRTYPSPRLFVCILVACLFQLTSPSTALEIFWVLEGQGQFDNPQNWNPMQVPGPMDVANFGSQESYDVVIGESAQTTAGLVVDDRLVRLLAGQWSVSGGSEKEPSVIVAPFDGNDTTLVFDLGLDLLSEYASIGRESGSQGVVFVRGGSFWNVSETLIVGESGSGGLNIAAHEGATVDVNTMSIARNAQNTGVVVVNGVAAKGGNLRPLRTGIIIIGDSGVGTLTVQSASIFSDTAVIGRVAGSEGIVEYPLASNHRGRRNRRVEDELRRSARGTGSLPRCSARFGR